MNYLQKKKLAFMSIVNRVKGFVRTVTGTLPLMLEGCVDEESIIDYTLYGQSVQDGTPTPETPIEVESVGEFDESTGKYKIPIKVSGKNLFDVSSVKKLYDSNGKDISNFLIVEDEVLRNKYGAYANSNYIPCNVTTLSAGTYTLSCEVSGTGSGYIGMFINKSNQRATFKNPNGVDWGEISYTFTLEEESTITGIQLQGFGNASNYLELEIYFRNIQIEESDTATDYEPYHEPITTNIYLDEPLGAGQSINYKKDSLPPLPTFKGTSIISTDTTIQPSNAEIEYYSNVKE